MAKQCQPIGITGTIEDVCFYRMEGKYYVRMKSSLTRKRVLKDPAFRLTRQHAATLGEASRIASRVYRLISKDKKQHGLYREMTGKAIYFLREGKDKKAIFQILKKEYLEVVPEDKKNLIPENKEDKSSASDNGLLQKSDSLISFSRLSRKGDTKSTKERKSLKIQPSHPVWMKRSNERIREE